MRILVACSSKYGATQGIAERIAARLRAAGDCTDTRPVTAAFSLDTYDAFVIGSAAYIGHWQKEATEFVQGNSAVLAGRPTWLFSSGPLGNEPTNALGLDQRVAAELKEIAELRATISPRDHRVFFGPWTRPSWGSGTGRSGLCPRAGRCCPRATSETGRTSTPGQTALPAS